MNRYQFLNAKLRLDLDIGDEPLPEISEEEFRTLFLIALSQKGLGGGSSEAPSGISGTISGPETSPLIGIPSTFAVAASAYPVYAALYKAGFQEGSRVAVAEAGTVNLTAFAGVYTARLYTAIAGGSLLSETSPFTPLSAEITGFIVGPSETPKTGEEASFTVSASSYPVYAALMSNGSQIGSRELLNVGGDVSFELASAVPYSVRLYTAATFGELITETAEFTPYDDTLTGTITGPAVPSVAGQSSSFSVSASGYPVWACLFKASADVGTRVPVYGAGTISFTPTTSVAHTARIYDAPTGGSMIDDTPSFTPSITGSITGPSSPATIDSPATFTVSASVYPVYAVLYKSGSDVGPRTTVAGPSSFTLTPSSVGSHTARIYTLASGGSLIASTAAFTPAVPSCSFSYSPSSLDVVSTASSNSFSLNANHEFCSWTATSLTSWLHITSVSSGTGTATVEFDIDANTGIERTGFISAGGHTFSVTQAAPLARFFGKVADADPSQATIEALASDNVNSRVKSLDVSPSDEYIVYAYPASFGEITTVYIDGDTGTNEIALFPTNGFDIDGVPYYKYVSSETFNGDLNFAFA